MEESLLTQLESSDILTTAQHFDGLHRDDPETHAIKRLMFAVLADAVRCFQACAGAESHDRRRLFVEAECWISDRGSDGPFTFAAVCETLGIEPNSLRDGLRRWRLQQLNGVNSHRLARHSRVTSLRRVTLVSPSRSAAPRTDKRNYGGPSALSDLARKEVSGNGVG